MSSRIIFRLPLLLLLAVASGCSVYKQNLMLQTPEDFKSAPVTAEVLKAERNYIIQKNDLLQLEVYSNKGEHIIEPNPRLAQGRDGTAKEERPEVDYLVSLDGVVKWPVVGEMKMEGLTLRQAEAMLQSEYSKYFTDAFVILKYVNKRVVVLGGVGGQVVPLTNQNMTLVEVLAICKGLPNESKAGNIKIVREDKVFVLDLSTVAGFQAGNMIVEPNDIIYVEPVRKPLAEGIRDYAALFSLFISTLSLIIVLTR